MIIFNNVLGPIAKFISLGFGAGKAPVAPGTWGTLVGIPIYLLMQDLSLMIYIIISAAIIALGIWAADVYGRELGVHDHQSIVWDEVAGYIVTMTFAPTGWEWIIVGFLLFRLFDIWKPWPINLLDKYVKGGFGVMIDDVLAGVYAGLILYLLAIFY